MKKLILTILNLLFLAGITLRAQEETEIIHFDPDSVIYSAEYLDTVDVKRGRAINDYSMIGFNYGVSFATVYFNPAKMGASFKFIPNYFSVMYTHYEKMFNYIPYFGVTAGLSYSHEGVVFETNPDTGLPLGYMDGAIDIKITTVEMPAMMHFHVDKDPVKILANLGGYVGYRISMERSGQWMDQEYVNKFHDYEYRFDYGVVGGAGIGFLIDPVEIHLNVLGRWSLNNLYQPDYYSEKFHPYNTYYYRYANPIDISVTLGVYFQLTKRSGKTSAQLRKQAREIVYGKTENTESQSR